MILRPLNPPEASVENIATAWDAILRTQKQAATGWRLITQCDHAELAGQMASRINHPDFPVLDADVIRAIELHDCGWTEVDNPRQTKLNPRGRPVSFFEESPSDIFRAWHGSIDCASAVTPIAGILVSEHFCRIAYDFSHAPGTASDMAQVLTTFLERQREAQAELCALQDRSSELIRELTDVLQFCDLLSLYVCCGAKESIEFPQKFNGRTISLHKKGEAYCLEPSLFKGGASLAIEAYNFPNATGATTIPILLV